MVAFNEAGGVMAAQIEALHQAWFFDWLRLQRHYPGVELAHASLNGAYLNGTKLQRAKAWARLKKQGAKSGVPDISLPVPRGSYHGLFIELKRPSEGAKAKGVLSDAQKEFIEQAREQGYHAAVCYGWEAAAQVVKDYYALGPFSCS